LEGILPKIAVQKREPIAEIFGNANLSKGKRTFLRLFYLVSPTKTLKTALRWIQPETYSHCSRVETLSIAVGNEYRRIHRRRINRHYLKTAAFFHDIGKLAIKHTVLKKKSKLTLSERRLVRKHPEIGNLIMKGLLPRPVCETILSHHEEMDKSGYPRGIGKDRMSSITEIVSTVDDYCAMTEARDYENRKSPSEAMEDLERQIDVRYDKRIVEALKFVIRELDHSNNTKEMN
jgi:HD-GYP domain-containing protein (c-di-GMP phosphodiesterase class II)